MTVRLNKWDGERFENDTRCSDCGRLASVVAIRVHYGQDPAQCSHPLDLTQKSLFMDSIIIFLCKSCLLESMDEIDQAVLENLVKTAEQRNKRR